MTFFYLENNPKDKHNTFPNNDIEQRKEGL